MLKGFLLCLHLSAVINPNTDISANSYDQLILGVAVAQQE